MIFTPQTSSICHREERQQIYNASQSNWWINESACCVIVPRDGRRRKETREEEKEWEIEKGRTCLEFCVQFQMSLLLGVRRWPYIRMFHIAFFPLIIVQNMAHRNTGRLQAKVIQRSHWAWCIQNHSCRHWGGQHKYTPIYVYILLEWIYLIEPVQMYSWYSQVLTHTAIKAHARTCQRLDTQS